MQLLRSVVSWLGRHVLLLLIVTLMIVVMPRIVQYSVKAASDFAQGHQDLRSLRDTELIVRNELTKELEQVEKRVNNLGTTAATGLRQRIREIDQELQAIAKTPAPSLLIVGFGTLRPNTDGMKKQALSKIRSTFLSQERQYAEKLLDYLVLTQSRDPVKAARELERLRKEHETAYARLKDNETAKQELLKLEPILTRLPTTSARATLQELKLNHEELLRQNADAFRKWDQQKKINEAYVAPKKPDRPWIRSPAIQDITESFSGVQTTLERQQGENWLGKNLSDIGDDAAKALPWAAAIVLAIVLTPILIKTVFYFVLAPIACRRPAISLLPQSQGAFVKDGTTTISSPSCEVTLDGSNELLVHPEYLQAHPNGSKNNTKWLLNTRYFLTSIAAGLYALTRTRCESPAMTVLSSKKDPLSELRTIPVLAGSPVVLQPRQLVGVLQPRGQPMQISSHWRLGSLHAWLTLQLRYLVFHGPAVLIVQGCRGVRVESVGGGRNIDPAATIGFSANLGYKSRRSEPCFSYLSGKQPLLHDSFAGTAGFYFYQEIPNSGAAARDPAKRLEGLVDALLKILGI